MSSPRPVQLPEDQFARFRRWVDRVGLLRIARDIGTARSVLQPGAKSGAFTQRLIARLERYLTTEPPERQIPCIDGCGAMVEIKKTQSSLEPRRCEPCQRRHRNQRKLINERARYARNRAILDEQREAGKRARIAAIRGDGQREWQSRAPRIVAILKQHGEPMTCAEIAVGLDIKSARSLSMTLSSMRMAGELRKIPSTSKSEAKWELIQRSKAAEVIDGIRMEWHHRITAGGTARVELVTRREGQEFPRWSKAIGPTEPRGPVVEAALKFWRAA